MPQPEANIVGLAVFRPGAGVDDDDLERLQLVADALQLRLDVGGGRDIAVGEMPEIELHPRLETPFERDFVDRPGALALVHRGMIVPGRIEMRAVVGGELSPARPPNPARPADPLVFKPGKNGSMPRQALLVIDVLDPGPGARRSAATSFCKGTEISIRRRVIDSSLITIGALRPRPGAGPCCAARRSVDVEFDRIAALEKAADLQPAAIADRAGTEEFARMDRLVLRGVGENLLEGEQHAARLPSRAGLAVDPHLDFQRLRIAEFVGRDDPGPQHIAAVEALALRRAEPALHFDRCWSRAEKSLKIV